jgi:hypothetical protein
VLVPFYLQRFPFSLVKLVDREIYIVSSQFVRGFISYAREDEDMCRALLTQLRPFERTGKIKFWADHYIQPGEDWHQEIIKALNAAHVAIFLVSGHMFASEFIWEEELPRACRRVERGDLVVIPVILRPVTWTIRVPGYCLARLQAVPRNAVPISKHPQPDEAYNDAARRIMGRVMSRWG